MGPTDQQLRNEIEKQVFSGVKDRGLWAIAYALMQLADAQNEAAVQLKYLGNGNAATQMGAIEAFGLHIGQKLDALTRAIEANND